MVATVAVTRITAPKASMIMPRITRITTISNIADQALSNACGKAHDMGAFDHPANTHGQPQQQQQGTDFGGVVGRSLNAGFQALILRVAGRVVCQVCDRSARIPGWPA